MNFKCIEPFLSILRGAVLVENQRYWFVFVIAMYSFLNGTSVTDKLVQEVNRLLHTEVLIHF